MMRVVDFYLLAGTVRRVRVTVSTADGLSVGADAYRVYAGVARAGFAEEAIAVDGVWSEGGWTLELPALEEGVWSWQLMVQDAASRVEWMIAGGEIRAVARLALGDQPVSPDETSLVAVIDSVTEQVEVTIDGSALSAAENARAAEASAQAAAVAEAAAAGSAADAAESAGSASSAAGAAAASQAAAAASAQAAEASATAASFSAERAEGAAGAAAGSATAASGSAEAASASATAAEGSAGAAAASAQAAAASEAAAAGSAADAAESAGSASSAAGAAASSEGAAAASAKAAEASAVAAASSAERAEGSAGEAAGSATAASGSAEAASASATAAEGSAGAAAASAQAAAASEAAAAGSAAAAAEAASSALSSAGAASASELAAAGSAAQAAEAAAASWHRVIPVFGSTLPADTELHHGDEVILIPEADSIDLAAAFAPVAGTYAVTFTLINESEAYLLVRDGEQMLCLVKPHSQIDGMAVRSDGALHVSVDQGAISEQTFAPDGTDEDVITLSDDGKTCIISWPNMLWSSQTLRYDLFPDYVKADDVEINAPKLLSANGLLDAIVPGSRAGTVRAYLPELRSAKKFCYITHFGKWVGDLPKLEDGSEMFVSSSMTSFTGDLHSLKTGDLMFSNCGLTSWDGDFPELVSATQMFNVTTKMTSFRTKMPKVTSSTSLVSGSKLVSVEISASKQGATTWFGTSPIETLRLSIPSFQKLDFSTSGIGACTPLETLEIFEDTDADGVMHAGLETCTTIKFYATHTSLSAPSVQNIVDAAADWSASSGVSALMQMPAGKLTEAQKSTLTAKGWTYSEV